MYNIISCKSCYLLLQDYLQKLSHAEDSCAIFICGNAARMVSDVLETLENVLGEEKVERMQRNKSIQIEAWA